VALAVPHEEWGSAIVALVVPRHGLPVRPGDVRRHVAARLPRYMVPWQVHVVDELPRTSTGKVDRRTLSELVASGAPST
jgi:acyl-CoA synthetase (AMP-forming)/AMP-acid ligase II